MIAVVSDQGAQLGARPGLCSQIELPDGRSLDIWQADPPDGDALVFHQGTPGAGLPFDQHVREMAMRGLFAWPWGFELGAIRCPVHVWQGAHDRMVPFGHGQWLAEHIPTACPHLFADHGHLSLLVDSFPRILDELLAAGG